ncbi:MAG: TIR domain-containing protein, partial [Bryobacteraceae bacterium]
MARRVFFSFHYDDDIWRANQVRNANVIAGSEVAGFIDRSEYEKAKKRGKVGIQRMIRRHLKNTTVTVVL